MRENNKGQGKKKRKKKKKWTRRERACVVE